VVVSVLGEEKQGGSLAVGPGGTIALPLVGTVSVVGKTLQEARAVIVKYLRELMNEPYVSVALDEVNSKRRVYVSGHVEKAGSHLLPLGATVADALADAVPGEEADLTQVKVRRGSGETVMLDMSGLRTGQFLENNLAVSWDDYVYVPLYDNRLTIVGQVNKPGAYSIPLGKKMRLVELLTQVAGGLTEGADHSSLLLLRDGKQEPEEVDLVKLLDTVKKYEIDHIAHLAAYLPEAAIQENPTNAIRIRGGLTG